MSLLLDTCVVPVLGSTYKVNMLLTVTPWFVMWSYLPPQWGRELLLQ